MARNNTAPPRDYLADSESSDSYEMGHYHHPHSSPPPPKGMNRTTFKPTKSRNVTVRSPSEEDFFERTFDTGGRRASTPHAPVRHSSSDDEDDKDKHHETHKAYKQRRKQKHKPVTESTAEKAADSAAESATAPPGVAPYNVPAGTTVQNGTNQVYLHSQPFGQPFGQPFIHNNNEPYAYAINYPGQPAPILIANPANMENYQNSAPANTGLHFQPQVPDTSMGPMIHNYRPSFDGGGVYYAQPGIAVCQPSVPCSYLVFPSPFIQYFTSYNQPIQPVTFAQAPLVAMPAVVPAVVVCPPIIASAPVYTTMGYKGENHTVAPREIDVVRRVSILQQCFSSFLFSKTRYVTCREIR